MFCFISLCVDWFCRFDLSRILHVRRVLNYDLTYDRSWLSLVDGVVARTLKSNQWLMSLVSRIPETALHCMLHGYKHFLLVQYTWQFITLYASWTYIYIYISHMWTFPFSLYSWWFITWLFQTCVSNPDIAVCAVFQVTPCMRSSHSERACSSASQTLWSGPVSAAAAFSHVYNNH